MEIRPRDDRTGTGIRSEPAGLESQQVLSAYQVPGHHFNCIRTHHGATCTSPDVGEQGYDQQSLLRRVQEMNEKVTIHMPPIQILRVGPFALRLGRAEIDDERVVPGGRVRRHAVLAPKELANGSPSFGCKGLDRLLSVIGHVDALGGPG